MVRGLPPSIHGVAGLDCVDTRGRLNCEAARAISRQSERPSLPAAVGAISLRYRPQLACGRSELTGLAMQFGSVSWPIQGGGWDSNFTTSVNCQASDRKAEKACRVNPSTPKLRRENADWRATFRIVPDCERRA